VIDYSFTNEKVEIELNISKEFRSIYDLAYTLIDLQALITSINYVTFEKGRYKSLPITSRSFAVQYRDELLLKSFKQGSFKSSLVSGLITGMIVLFADKYYDSKKATAIEFAVPQVTSPLTESNQRISVNIEQNINIDNSVNIDVNSNNINNEPFEDNMNENDGRTFNVRCQNDNTRQRMQTIIDNTEIIPGNPEASTHNLINNINSSGILEGHQIPTDEQGIKAIATSVERFTKSIE